MDHDDRRATRRALVAVKTIHTLAWFSIESCMVYLLYLGFVQRSDRRAAVAAVVVGGESLISPRTAFAVRSPMLRNRSAPKTVR